MTKRKYSEVEMIGALKQMEAGRSAAEVGRELGVSKHTVYAWKAKYGGRRVGGAQRPKKPGDEKRGVEKAGGGLRLGKEMVETGVLKKRGRSQSGKREGAGFGGKFLCA